MEQSNKKTGFSLVEVLVAITVFTLVIGIATGLFVHVLESQRKALAYQELFDQTSFAMEYITRGVRMAKKQRTATDPIIPPCISIGRSYDNTGENRIRFIRWDGTLNPPAFVCYEFFLEGTILKVKRVRNGVIQTSSLTSGRLRVLNLRFRVDGDGIETVPPQRQPRVTIVLEVEGREYIPGRRARIHLQTTVSQRDLDI